MGAVRIHTDRLWLRPFAPGDTDRLHVVFDLPDVRRYLLDDEIESSRASFADHGWGLWCLALEAEDGGAIGFAGYREFREPPVMELIYGIDPDHRGASLAYEASRAAARYGFEALGCDPIPLSLDVPNEASLRLALRLGATEVGREPGAVWEQIHLELSRASFEPDPGRYEVSPEPQA